MNNELTEIAFILDRSGSMQSNRRDAISGFNEFLRDQIAAPGPARFTLVLFDDEFLVPCDHLPIEEVVPLTTDTYIPRGATALLDAIGETIERINVRIAQSPDAARPGKVIVATLTDGMENSSTRFKWRDIAALIKKQREDHQWEFLFLGANQDAIATAANLNIDRANTSSYVGDGVGTRSSHRGMSRKVTAMRTLHSAKKSLGKIDPKIAADASADLSNLVEEEDERDRNQ